MKALISKATTPILHGEMTGVTPDFSLEIEPQGQGEILRLPVQVKVLTPEEVVLEVIELPQDLKAESLLDQSGVIRLAPDGFSKETQFRTTVAWVRQDESSPAHYLLGLDLQAADFRFRRSLESILARPKDISDLWRHWDQGRTSAVPGDGRFIFYLGAAAVLVGVALHVVLPDSHKSTANLLILLGSLVIAGKCLWHWWRERGLPAEAKDYRAGNS
jgi:hypothetical protein